MCTFNSVALNENVTETWAVSYLKSLCENLMKSRIALFWKSSPESDTDDNFLSTKMTAAEMNVGTFVDFESGISVYCDTGALQAGEATGFH
jgi:hypothetical protein